MGIRANSVARGTLHALTRQAPRRWKHLRRRRLQAHLLKAEGTQGTRRLNCIFMVDNLKCVALMVSQGVLLNMTIQEDILFILQFLLQISSSSSAHLVCEATLWCTAHSMCEDPCQHFIMLQQEALPVVGEESGELNRGALQSKPQRAMLLGSPCQCKRSH